MNKNLLIGWSERDITPGKPVSLQGQFYKRISSHVESPISVTAMALEAGGDHAVICSCDLCSISDHTIQMVRKNLSSRAPGLDPLKIIVAATHIHTGPDCRDSINVGLHAASDFLAPERRPIPEENPPGVMPPNECEVFIASEITAAVIEAWEKRKPSYFSRQLARAVVGHCRRVSYFDKTAKMYGNTNTESFDCPEGYCDSGIELLYTFNSEKELSGIVINIACPSQVVEHKSFISSDYWGEVRKGLRAVYGESIFILCQCSAAGDQSPRDMVRIGRQTGEPSMYDVEGKAEIGRRVTNAVCEKYASARELITGAETLIHKCETINFPTRTVEESEYLAAKKSFDDYVAASKKERFDSEDMAALHTYAGIMKRFEYQKNNPHYSAEVHFIRLDDIAIATSPFELFLDFGLRIKARSKAEQTFLIQLACDSGGYLPTEKAERGGHYSAVVASGKTGHEGGELLVGRTLEVLNSFWE